MGVRRYCCASPDYTHSRFFCQSCKSKACSACGFKATEQWVSQQSHILPDCDWQHITFTMPFCCGPFSTTTVPCSMPCSALPPAPCSAGPAGRAWRWVPVVFSAYQLRMNLSEVKF
nr:transposase zinc-binding domain-containing protein [Enterobacter sp. BIDMC 29]